MSEAVQEIDPVMKLAQAVATIEQAIKRAEQAEHLPAERRREAEALRVSRDTSWGGRMSDRELSLAKILHKTFIEANVASGEAERDAIKADCAAVIERWRPLLPALAAKACIAAGVSARAIQPEGSGQ